MIRFFLSANQCSTKTHQFLFCGWKIFLFIIRWPQPLCIQRNSFKCLYSSLYCCFILLWAPFHYCRAKSHLTDQQLMMLHCKLSVRWFCSCIVVHLGDHRFTMLLESKTSETAAEKEYKFDYFYYTLVLNTIIAWIQSRQTRFFPIKFSSPLLLSVPMICIQTCLHLG